MLAAHFYDIETFRYIGVYRPCLIPSMEVFEREIIPEKFPNATKVKDGVFIISDNFGYKSLLVCEDENIRKFNLQWVGYVMRQKARKENKSNVEIR